MATSAFIETPEVIARIAEVKEYAAKNPYRNEDIQKMMAGIIVPAGLNPQHNLRIELGYNVAFSHEIQTHPDAGVKRYVWHLSVFKDPKLFPGQVPAPFVVDRILELFGFPFGLSHSEVFFDKAYLDKIETVNVLQEIKDVNWEEAERFAASKVLPVVPENQ